MDTLDTTDMAVVMVLASVDMVMVTVSVDIVMVSDTVEALDMATVTN